MVWKKMRGPVNKKYLVKLKSAVVVLNKASWKKRKFWVGENMFEWVISQ